MIQTKNDQPDATRKTRNKTISFDNVIRDITREKKENEKKEQEKKKKAMSDARIAAQREKKALASKKASQRETQQYMETSQSLETDSDENEVLNVEYIPGKCPSCCANQNELKDICSKCIMIMLKHHKPTCQRIQAG